LTTGQTVTRPPDATSCAATPTTTVEPAAAGPTELTPEMATTWPPVMAAEAVLVNGLMPPVYTGL
jgi:hypothetical protein